MGTSSSGTVHALPLPSNPEKPRIGLSPVDAAGIRLLSRECSPEVVELARGYAESLSGPDSAGCRKRLLARAIATTETTRGLLEGQLVVHLQAGDLRAVGLVDRVLLGLTTRLVKLLEAQRHEELGGRPLVAIAAANVNISSGT